MVTDGETTRSGQQISTMRHVGWVAMNISPAEWRRRAKQKSIMAKQLDQAPRWQLRPGYFPGGVGRKYGQTKKERGTSESVTVCRAAIYYSAGTRKKRGEIVERRCHFGRVGSVFDPPRPNC